MFLAQIPGYSEALAAVSAQDAEARDFAFLGLPKEICGIEVVLLTLRQYLRLLLLKNPLVVGGTPSPGHVVEFLWLLSPGYVEAWVPGAPDAQEAHRKDALEKLDAFIARVGFMDLPAFLAQIRAYLDFIFADAPGGSGEGGVAVTSFAAVITDLLGREYGWTRDEVLDTPLPVIYQQLRRIILHHNPKAAIINRRTDAVNREFLQKLNPGGAAA
jgi:hypothetical protein